MLTSTQNYVWLSMQEIIPMIESVWHRSAERGRHRVLAKRILTNRERYRADPKGYKIFSSYADEDAKVFLKAYGMRESIRALDASL
ncbi:MAG TPA: hypothetical protein VF088_18755 [Pyrinomonadaceae bacterium]